MSALVWLILTIHRDWRSSFIESSNHLYESLCTRPMLFSQLKSIKFSLDVQMAPLQHMVACTKPQTRKCYVIQQPITCDTALMTTILGRSLFPFVASRIHPPLMTPERTSLPVRNRLLSSNKSARYRADPAPPPWRRFVPFKSTNKWRSAIGEASPFLYSGRLLVEL